MEKGLFSPETTMLDQKLSTLCPVSTHRYRLVFKYMMKVSLLLQSPLRMACVNVNGFGKAKISNNLHILYHLFLKACLKKVLKKKHRMF